MLVTNTSSSSHNVFKRFLNSGSLPAFSPFPTMFSKGFFFKVVKSWDGAVKVKQPILRSISV